MAEGRYFENDFIAISQPWIIRFLWNLLCRCMFRFREWSPDEKSKFCILKMADGRHLEYCNLATSQRYYCPVDAKFGKKKLNHSQTQVMWSK